jgi:hypothetical protein
MIYAITQFVNFDVEKERERLNSCFEDDVLHRQLHIFQLFLDGNYDECYKCIALLPYDKENECDEAEYVCPFIFECMRSIKEIPNVRIEPIHESESTSSEAKG